jgi:hypothetical protein
VDGALVGAAFAGDGSLATADSAGCVFGVSTLAFAVSAGESAGTAFVTALIGSTGAARQSVLACG